MPRTSSAYDFEVLLADGVTWLGLMLAPPRTVLGPGKPYADGAARSVADELAAAVGGDPLSQDLSARVVEDWSGGVGVSYNAAYSLYTRTEGYVLPAGAGYNEPVPATGHPSNSPLVAFAEYNGNLYVAQRGSATVGGRVLKLVGGKTPLVEDFFLASPGDLLRDLLVGDDGSGNTVLFASSESATHTNGRLHRLTTTPGTWTSTTAGTEFAASRGLGRMAYVYWRTADGSGGWRIVTISGQKTVAYTFPDVNPMTGTSVWSPDIKIGTTGSLLEIAGMRRHVYFGATDDLYDIDEMGDSQAMTSYLRRMTQSGNGYAVETLNSYVYLAVGRGLIRVYVGDGHFDESPLEGQCAPGWGTPAENDGRGYVTAMCVDQGYLVVAVFNDTTHKSYVYWGLDRRNATKQVTTSNPMLWYGPEVVIGSTTPGSAAGWRITRMTSSGLAGDLRLWIASEPISADGTVSASPPRLDYVTLPTAGSPIQDLLSQGTHRFAPGHPPPPAVATSVLQPICSLVGLAESGGDKANTSYVYQYSVGSRGLDVVTGTELTLWERADAGFDALGTDSPSWVNQSDITHGPIQNVTPGLPSVVSGHKLQYRVDFSSPLGAAGNPAFLKVAVLDSLRTLVWEKAPSFYLLTLAVHYGDGVQDVNGTRDTLRQPDDISEQLHALADGKQTLIRDRNDQKWVVAFRQVTDGTTEYVDGGIWGKRVTTRLQLQVLNATT